MNIRTYNSYFGTYSEKGWSFRRGSCHQSAQNHSTTKFAVEIFVDQDYELIKEWLKYLKTIGISTKVKLKLKHEKDFIVVDYSKMPKYNNSPKKKLFAYQLVRLCLKNSSFVKRVLKNANQYNKMKAWDVIYLTWNLKPETRTSWYDYYDSFINGRSFQYVSLRNLLKLIEEGQGVSYIITNIEENNADLSKVTNEPITKQLKQSNLQVTYINSGFGITDKAFTYTYDNEEWWPSGDMGQSRVFTTKRSKKIKIRLYAVNRYDKNHTRITKIVRVDKKSIIEHNNKIKEYNG